MKSKAVIHEAEECGFWAQIPAIPGCATRGKIFEELRSNVYEAVEGWLNIDMPAPPASDHSCVIKIAV